MERRIGIALWLLHDATLIVAVAGFMVSYLRWKRRRARPRCSRCGRYGAGRGHACPPRKQRRSDQ